MKQNSQAIVTQATIASLSCTDDNKNVFEILLGLLLQKHNLTFFLTFFGAVKTLNMSTASRLVMKPDSVCGKESLNLQLIHKNFANV
jgi:hypothetical protein